MTPIKEIPVHLKPFLVEQDYGAYTPTDQAAWRYIIHVSRDYFKEHAHDKYLKGLEETGITLDRIPRVSEMDEKLKKFGWRAVAVSGFVPPAIFMEFQSLGILPIACDMRQPEHIAYTPAPDIVHEAAGHAPILSDPKFAKYLRSYGEIAKHAIPSLEDMEVFWSIRNLSIVKEEFDSTDDDIDKAQKRLDEALGAVSYLSEAAMLARMNWWTVEYGLVGELKDPKIFGAGLLSSVGESYHCLGENVKKIPFSLKCVETSYDITRPQPQLFVAKDFDHLSEVLDEMAETLSYRKGGIGGLATAKKARVVVTVELDAGIQMSGVLSEYREKEGELSFLKFSSPVQLSFQNKQLPGHDEGYHSHGYSTPVGEISGLAKPISKMTDDEIKSAFPLKYTSGIEVSGDVQSIVRKNDLPVLIEIKNCKITNGDEILFDPSWGTFDLALGTSCISVFAGASDRLNYRYGTIGYIDGTGTQKSNFEEEKKPLYDCYEQVALLRENSVKGKALEKQLSNVYEKLSEFPNDWLLRLEMLELFFVHSVDSELKSNLMSELESISGSNEVTAELISRGKAAFLN